MNEENGLLYLHTDHLGSSVGMSSGNAGSEGEVVGALAYKPYGGNALSETEWRTHIEPNKNTR
jgi:hypothetical protein